MLMVQQHMGLWLLDIGRAAAHSPTLLRIIIGINLLGGAAAPLFVVLSGVGAALSMGAPAGTSERARPAMVLRGIVLFTIALLMNWLTPSWFSMGSFYVLHLISFFWCITPALRRLRLGALSALASSALLLGWAGQKLLRTPPYLSNERMSDLSLPGGALRLALFEGHFPIFPWLAFALSGFIVGRVWTQRTRRAQNSSTPSLTQRAAPLEARSGLGSACMAYVFVLAAGFGLMIWQSAAPRLVWRLQLRQLTSFSFYPATTAFVLVMAATASLVAFIALWAGERLAWRASNPLASLGRLSLTILVVHVVAFRQGAAELGFARQLPLVGTVLTILGLLAVFALVEPSWARRRYRFSLEWLLRRADAWVPRLGGRP